VSSPLTEGGTGAADQQPLTPAEYRTVQRLFSDPFAFPKDFTTWLVGFLETSDMNLPISAVNGLTQILGVAGVGTGTLGIFPAGIILPYGGQTAPAGSLFCDGSSYLRTTYARLYKAIGTQFGAPDANSFNVPDLRGRVPVGAGPNAYVSTMGQNEGAALSARAPVHRTSDAGGATSEGITSGADAQVRGSGTTPAELGVHHHGPDGYPIDTPAYIVFNFIIIA
jgi:microcystin-dependent protein